MRGGATVAGWHRSLLPALAWALLAATAMAPVAANAAPADACGPQLTPPARQVVATDGLTVVFAPRPWPIPVGRHFALDIALCPAAGAAMPATLRVDADMPAHRHGMNYRPSVQAQGGGRFVADGLMFHMPGRWRVTLQAGDRPVVTHDIVVE